MKLLLLRTLPLAVFLVLCAFVLHRIYRIQASQYPTAAVSTEEASLSTPKERPVSPLFNPGLAPQLLEGKARDKWQKPQALVDALQLKPGEIVADVGAGSGYLMPYLSRSVGKRGGVYEEEIQEAYVPVLRQKARNLPNVRVVLGRANDPRLPRRSIDCFMLLTVYHEVEHPVAFLHTLRKAASPNARLAIVDFDAAIKGNPPAPDGHWISEQTVVEEAQAAGWELVERPDLLRRSSQFYLIFRPRKP